MSLTLHPVKRTTKASNRYCGPSSLSILTGLDTADTARLLRHVSGKRSIKGTARGHMRSALSLLGYSATSWEVAPHMDWVQKPEVTTHRSLIPKGRTLIRWLRESRAARGTDTFLLIAGNHYSVVQGRRYGCGLTKALVPFSAIPHRKCRVSQVYRIEHNGLRLTPAQVIAALPKVVAKATFLSQTADRIAVKRLAEPYSIDVDDSQRDRDNTNGTIWVYGGDQWPEGLADPFDDEHYHYDWASARKAVETYIAALVTYRAERPLGAPEPVTFVS